MQFFRKHWSNIIFFALVALLIIPQTRIPIQVFVQRLISFSPSETEREDQPILQDYNWKLHTMNSEEINFSQSKGEVIIVNFWATWCPPCIAEMPSFQKLYDTFGTRVDFYFVTSEKPKTIEAFLVKNQYNLPVFLQNTTAPDMLGAQVLPTTYLISKSGKIVVHEEGVANWNAESIKVLLESLLSK